MGDGDGLPGPTDAWTTLAGLARETSRIRLGTLVSSATFRHPGVLAIQVAQVDQMSGGRVELGLGAGWFAQEHAAYGIPFPEKRFGLLTEQLEIITGLWGTPAGSRYDFAGEHYTLTDSPALPKPVQTAPTRPCRSSSAAADRADARAGGEVRGRVQHVLPRPDRRRRARRHGAGRVRGGRAGPVDAHVLRGAGAVRGSRRRRGGSSGRGDRPRRRRGARGRLRRDADRGGRPDRRPTASSASSACTCRSWTCTTWTTSSSWRRRSRRSWAEAR